MVRGIGRLAVGHHQFPYLYTAAVVFMTILQVASAFHMPGLEATMDHRQAWHLIL